VAKPESTAGEHQAIDVFDREAAEWLTQLRAADRSVGGSLTERLLWLLRFSGCRRSDLVALKSSQLAKLRAEVSSFAQGAKMNMSGPSLSAGEVADLAETLADAISNLIDGDPKGPGWYFSPWNFGRLYRAIQPRTFAAYWFGEPRPVFMMAASELLAAEGRRIRTCAWQPCSKVFVRRKGGRFCSNACSQKARTSTYKKLLGPEEWGKRRHGYYQAKLKKEKGEAVAKKARQRIQKD